MNWTDLLKSEIETTYAGAARLIGKVDPDSLEWKPATGSNWMTVGQLLKHIAGGCGPVFKGFLTGDWGLPEGMKMEDIPPEEMLPPAETLPTVKCVEEAAEELARDKAVALAILDEAGEKRLNDTLVAAPWSPNVALPLGRQYLMMVQHIEKHKSQLFYYLKLQGKTVNTADLWG